jgi:hypothetical protein
VFLKVFLASWHHFLTAADLNDLELMHRTFGNCAIFEEGWALCRFGKLFFKGTIFAWFGVSTFTSRPGLYGLFVISLRTARWISNESPALPMGWVPVAQGQSL